MIDMLTNVFSEMNLDLSMVLDAQKGTLGSVYDGLLDNLISTEYLPR